MSNVVKCPKCGGRRLHITEVIEAYSEHVVEDGVWLHGYDNNEYGGLIRIECSCDACGHQWNSRKSDFDDMYESTVDGYEKDNV